MNVAENTSADTRCCHFWKRNTQAGTMYSNVTWQQPTTPCVLWGVTSSGTRACRALATMTTRSKLHRNMVYRRLLGQSKARTASMRLDRLEWAAAYVRTTFTLSHWITRQGCATKIIFALPSARAPSCSLRFSVSGALMVCGSLGVGNSYLLSWCRV